jgi:NIMA (never in mitosis gene a)-related kinase
MATMVRSLGQVVLVENVLTNKKYVSKRIPIGILGDSEKRAALQEANLLRNLKHVHIVEYVESFIENNSLVIIMEYCSGLIIRRRSL